MCPRETAHHTLLTPHTLLTNCPTHPPLQVPLQLPPSALLTGCEADALHPLSNPPADVSAVSAAAGAEICSDLGATPAGLCTLLTEAGGSIWGVQGVSRWNGTQGGVGGAQGGGSGGGDGINGRWVGPQGLSVTVVEEGGNRELVGVHPSGGVMLLAGSPGTAALPVQLAGQPAGRPACQVTQVGIRGIYVEDGWALALC